MKPSFTKPFPGHRVIANLYAVGTYDLGVFLVTSDDGHILINTGVEDSEPQIRSNIEALGFRLEDVEILLCMQSHWDHAAAMAEIKDITGAQLWTTPADAPILEDGGLSDPHFGGMSDTSFKPIGVDKLISHGDLVEIGDTRLEVHEHPGHTQGSSSYSMRVTEHDRDYDVVIANMGTVNAGKRMFIDPTYPGCGDDFALTFRRQKEMDTDVWVAAHGSHYHLHDKYVPGQADNPDTFVDPAGFLAAIERLERLYLDVVAAERAE